MVIYMYMYQYICRCMYQYGYLQLLLYINLQVKNQKTNQNIFQYTNTYTSEEKLLMQFLIKV